IDVGDRQPGALGSGLASDAAGNTACALKGDMQTVEAVLAERPLHRRLDPQKYAERRMRPRVAANFTAADRQAGDELSLLRNLDHVGDRHADVLSSHIFAAQRIYRCAESRQHL